MPPPPSGPNPYENAFDASGLSTTIREYGGPGIACGAGFVFLAADISQNHRKYSDPRGRGRSGKSAGGGKGLSSGPRSSHNGWRSCSFCSIGIAFSNLRRVSRTHSNLQSAGGTIFGGPSCDRISPTAWYHPGPAS
jgi:hypothetical protein